MNIISIVNGKIDKTKISNDLQVKEDNISINVISDSNLYLEILGDKNLKIDLNILENVSFRVFVFCDTSSCNINFDIIQSQNSNLIMNNFYKNNDTFINANINLSGINSNLEYNYSCLGKTNKKLRINHNFPKTNSIVKSHAVSCNDEVEFEITEFVPKGSINCNLSQNSKIINLKENKGLIKPILLIDEKEVNATHSSIVTPINDSDLLYLMSRGIEMSEATNLLVNGFLINNLSLIDEEKHILFEKHIFRR